MSINQAVVFTKPLHHLVIDLSPDELDARARAFFTERGFNFVLVKKVSGVELVARDVIRRHYLMYSKAALADEIAVSEEGRSRFEEAFATKWSTEVDAGRIPPLRLLLESRKIGVHELFGYWNALFTAGKTAKIQEGMIMAFCEELDAYLVNAFYPCMQANFYHPDTVMHYYVVEFDSDKTSWLEFRKQMLGATNSANAHPQSFRGQLYAEYPVDYPGSDNFVHGSAGPLEGFVERAIHETGFDMQTNPIGRYLSQRNVTLESFARWKDAQSIKRLGRLFDATEEKDTDEILSVLDGVSFEV